MKIVRHQKYKNQEKKLKKRYENREIYEKIINHIKQCDTINELENNCISKMYGYEALKDDLSGYHSFNLCKNRGRIRLIFTVNREQNEIKLIYISTEHYEDFKKVKKDFL